MNFNTEGQKEIMQKRVNINDLGHWKNRFVTDSYGDCTVTYPVRGLEDKSQNLLNLSSISFWDSGLPGQGTYGSEP